MAVQSLLAKLGVRLGTLGSAASLAFAYPLSAGDISMDSHTGAARNGTYSVAGVSVGHVVNGKETFTVAIVGNHSSLSGATNEMLGTGAGNVTMSGTQNVLVGNNAGNSLTNGAANVVVGGGAGTALLGGSQNTIIGAGAGTTLTTGNYNVLLGANAGDSTAAGATNHFVVGALGFSITDMYVGGGENTTNPPSIIFHATGGHGANNFGASLTLAGGIGTGTGVGGSVVIQTAPVTGSSSTPNTLTTRWTVAGDGGTTWTGIATASAPALSPANAGTIYYDSTAQTFYQSSNGAAYAPIGAGTIGGSIANTQVAVGSGANTIAGSANLTWAASTLNVTGQIITSGNIVGSTSYPTLITAIIPADGSFEVSSDGGTHFNAIGYQINGGSPTNDMIFWTFAAGGHAPTEVMRMVNGGGITGHIQMVGSTPNTTSFNIQQGTAPSSPNNGDVWMTSAGMWCQAGGVTIGPFGAGTGTVTGSGTTGQVTYWSGASAVTGNADFTFSTTAGLHVSMSGATNEMHGTNAGNSTLSGTNLVLFGNSSGVGLTTGTDCTFIGFQAGTGTTIGNQNTVVGSGAFAAVNTSGGSTVVGYQAAASATVQTTAFGTSCLGSLTSGGSNTAFGANALNSVTGNGSNTAVGAAAAGHVTGNANTAIGTVAMIGHGGSSSGSNNVAVGYQALFNFTTDSNTTAIGYNALQAQQGSTGNNVAVGYQSGNAVVTATNIVAVGYDALLLATGSGNTALGATAGAVTTTGTNNIFLGLNSGDSTANNSVGHFVAGGNSAAISAAWFGNGETNAAPQNFVWNATGGTGSNIAGASMTLAGGIGTGTGVGGAVIIQTAPITGSSSTPNTLTTRLTVGGDGGVKWTGIATTAQPATSGANNGTLYYDSTAQAFMASTNNGAYVAFGSGSTSGSGATGQLTFWSGTTVLTGNADFTVSTTAGVHLSLAGATNEMLGTSAGNSTLTATHLTLHGNNAGVAITSGGDTVCIGYQAGQALTSGSQSIAIGSGALLTASTVSDCTAIGYNALTLNTSAQMTAVGSQALAAHTSGTGNTAFGYQAFNALQTGTNSTAIGFKAGLKSTASSNTLIGASAGAALVGGNSNTAIGTLALSSLVSSGQNTAVGQSALGNTTGQTNTAVGYQAGQTTQGGTANVFLGAGSGDATDLAASSRFVVGSNSAVIGNVFIGNGETNGAPQNVIYNATGGSGSNVAGASFTIAGGIGTGTGAGGSVIIQVAKAGSTGSTANTLATALTIDQKGNTIQGTAALGTTATDGFLYLESCAGAPTGVATVFTGRNPIIIDTSTGTGKLWVNIGGTWRGVLLT